MKVEFFHDVICSYCFAMSDRMRKIEKEMPELEIVHRSFALVHDVADFNTMFGLRENAKDEIMKHWEHANQNDDLHRFNIEGMKKENFLFPSSMNALLACEAVKRVGSEKLYWDAFDLLQHALFVESRDVGSIDVIEEYIKELPIDFNAWKKCFNEDETRERVETDFELAKRYGITSVPNIIVNGKYQISGAQPFDVVIETLKKIKDVEMLETQVVEGDACSIEDGKMNC